MNADVHFFKRFLKKLQKYRIERLQQILGTLMKVSRPIIGTYVVQTTLDDGQDGVLALLYYCTGKS